jgi:D-lactate dehydrogenase (cytochrome)
MVATGASGTTTVRYGGMRENLLALECILANGDPPTIVHAGTRALKNSAGYDLVSLLCGSEGTLGVITSVTVKLHPIPQHVVGAVCVFSSLRQAAQAVAALKLNDIPLSRCELLDATSVQAFNSYKPDHSREVKPTLFLEFQGSSEASIQEQVAMAESICTEEHYGSNFEFASSEEDRNALWSARHTLYNASLALRPGATNIVVTDACVPVSQFAALIEGTVADVEKFNVVGPCFGHAGDGNLHCLLPLLDDDSPDYLARVEQVKENLIARTLRAGGTCTGEHGIGCGKIQYLEQQYGSGAVAMMKLVKRALDPCNIMNPGKVLPLD